MDLRTCLVAAALAALGPSCGSAGPTRGDAGEDGGLDAAVDAEGVGDGGDGGLSCGDERGPLPIPPAPIVNGTSTWDPTVVDLSPGQAMAVGALMVRDPLGWGNGCTATLVAPRLVLTAAHCVVNPMSWPLGSGTLAPAALRFGLGADASEPDALLEASEVVRHPDYVWATNSAHDVAVLVLAADATLAAPGIEPIPPRCEPLDGSDLVGSRIQNVGYGSTTAGTEPDANTARHWTTTEATALSDVDFTLSGHGLTGVCHGDSGGPALWTDGEGRIVVAGVASRVDATHSCVDDSYFARTDDSCDFLLEHGGGCGEVTAEGSCEGERAVWCNGFSVEDQDCAAAGGRCGDDGSGRFRCIEQDPCGGETAEGRCEGETAVWCEGGAVLRRRCADCLQRCGWSDAHAGVYCI